MIYCETLKNHGFVSYGQELSATIADQRAQHAWPLLFILRAHFLAKIRHLTFKIHLDSLWASSLPSIEADKPDPVRPNEVDAHVVFLVNFLSPNLVEVMREISRQVRQFEILVSVPMEANRQFEVDGRGLNVICQRTWTRRKVVSHPGGYSEELYVHVPLDTWSQLRRLRPDCIVSLEMGMRSLQSSIYRRCSAKTRHVLSVYGSERSEAGRGRLRHLLRSYLLKSADVITYNGPSCQRYLLGRGAEASRMLPWNYAADPQKIYRGELLDHWAAQAGRQLKLLTVSQLIERKGVDRGIEQVNRWARTQPGWRINWAIAGTGPQLEQLRQIPLPENVSIEWLGNCDVSRLKQLYADYPFHLFPTLGDEWGLVVDEALGSGQLVLGSQYAQACETLIEPGRNGWTFNPDQSQSLLDVLDAITRLDQTTFENMRKFARASVSERTALHSACQFVGAVRAALGAGHD